MTLTWLSFYFLISCIDCFISKRAPYWLERKKKKNLAGKSGDKERNSNLVQLTAIIRYLFLHTLAYLGENNRIAIYK